MEVLRMYKEMNVTIAELETALFRLDYVKKSADDYVTYSHGSGSKVYIPTVFKSERVLNKGWFVANASNMMHFGVIEHRDDLAKLVETMRLEAVSTAA
jgi:hypothetical protein